MTTPSPERDKALDAALAQIDKQYGKGSIMRMGEKGSLAIESIPTGALPLDLALGVGGLPRGRVVEIYGPESSGKSTLAMHVVAEAQRNGGICAYIDAEHAMDPVYAKAIGVDIDQLLISQPDTGEQALEIAMLHAFSKGVAQNTNMITFLERKGLCVSIRKTKQK